MVSIFYGTNISLKVFICPEGIRVKKLCFFTPCYLRQPVEGALCRGRTEKIPGMMINGSEKSALEVLFSRRRAEEIPGMMLKGSEKSALEMAFCRRRAEKNLGLMLKGSEKSALKLTF